MQDWGRFCLFLPDFPPVPPYPPPSHPPLPLPPCLLWPQSASRRLCVHWETSNKPETMVSSARLRGSPNPQEALLRQSSRKDPVCGSHMELAVTKHQIPETET